MQTCIVNKDKRHAFVKMISRQDAIAAKDAMEKNRAPDSQLRVSSVVSVYLFLARLLTVNRRDGALDLVHVNAATTRPVSALFQSTNLLMLIGGGW